VANYSFFLNDVGLIVSLSFLLVAIWRISRILKQQQEIQLKDTHVSLLAVFLFINFFITLLLSVVFMLNGGGQRIDVIVSLFYFALEPISLLLMILLIARMSAQTAAGSDVRLFVDDQGRYRFI